MKTTILMLMLATAGFAQVVAKVPFPFEAGGVKFGEGKYAVSALTAAHGSAWVVRNQETREAAIVYRLAQDDAKTDGKGGIRFRCTGSGRCALTEFWQPGQARNVLMMPKWAREAETDRLVALGR
jgi:hypothetical protein